MGKIPASTVITLGYRHDARVYARAQPYMAYYRVVWVQVPVLSRALDWGDVDGIMANIWAKIAVYTKPSLPIMPIKNMVSIVQTSPQATTDLISNRPRAGTHRRYPTRRSIGILKSRALRQLIHPINKRKKTPEGAYRPDHDPSIPPGTLGLLHARGQRGRRAAIARVAGGGRLAHDELAQRYARGVDLEDGGLWVAPARRGDEAMACGVFAAL